MSRKGTTRAWRKLVQQVLAEEGWICHLCKQPGANSGDHLIPASIRPDLEMERWNIRAAHLACNKKRGTKPVAVTDDLATSRNW